MKKAALASPATAFASSVLPVPGGPTSSTPFGAAAPSVEVPLRVVEVVADLLQLGERLAGSPATDGERDLARSASCCFFLPLPRKAEKAPMPPEAVGRSGA